MQPPPGILSSIHSFKDNIKWTPFYILDEVFSDKYTDALDQSQSPSVYVHQVILISLTFLKDLLYP